MSLTTNPGSQAIQPDSLTSCSSDVSLVDVQSPLPIHQPDPGPRKAGRADTRRINLRTVLDLIAAGGTTTRAEVARATGLTRATVSTLVGELINDGLVIEAGKGESVGGKPPTLIELDRSGRQLIAVDLSADPFCGMVVDLSGRPVGDLVSADPSSGRTLDHQAELERLVNRLMKMADSPLIGVAVASPGVIAEDGTVVEASNLDWHNHPLAKLTREATGLPVTVVNDAQAAAITTYIRLNAERANDESEAALSDLILVQLVGAGVGAGIILGGRTHHGSHRAAGEIGHSVIDPLGERCHCGNTGCLETLASVSAIYHRIAGRKPKNDRWSLEQAKADFGEEAVEAALVDAGTAIGSAFSILVSALDVSLVAISMQPTEAAPVVAQAVDDALRPRVLAALRPDLQVTVVEGDDLSLLGAAAVVLHQEYGLSWHLPAVLG